jgi:hypothetical protein
VTGAFASLGMFYLAYKWPLLVFGHVWSAMSGLGVRAGSLPGGGGGGLSDGALASKAKDARTRLQASLLSGGRGVGFAAGQLGAPQGGLVGLAKGEGRRASLSASGNALRCAPAGTPVSQRLSRAGRRLRETPGRMRDAWRAGEALPRLAAKPPTATPGAQRRARRRHAGAGPAGWDARPGGESGGSGRPSGPRRPGSAPTPPPPSTPVAPVPAGRADSSAAAPRPLVPRAQQGRERRAGAPSSAPPGASAVSKAGSKASARQAGSASRQAGAPARPHPGTTPRPVPSTPGKPAVGRRASREARKPANRPSQAQAEQRPANPRRPAPPRAPRGKRGKG